jgi:hypothetical protein
VRRTGGKTPERTCRAGATSPGNACFIAGAAGQRRKPGTFGARNEEMDFGGMAQWSDD